MTGADFAVIGAVAAALITAAASIVLTLYQRKSVLRAEHLQRASEMHLPHYEKIFVTARTVQDSLRDYSRTTARISDRSDPFLQLLLKIVQVGAYQYCVAVDWRHNSAMAYLEIKLEERCLHARNLLLQWLSRQRMSVGDIASIRRHGTFSSISIQEVSRLRGGDYEELRIERRTIVNPHRGDRRLASQIDRALSSVIVELKAVMSR